MYELEATATSLQLNNTALSDVVESRDALVGELNDRVAVFEEDRVVLKAALRQLQREMSDEAPRHAKVAEDLEAAVDGEIDLGGGVSALSRENPTHPSLPPSELFFRRTRLSLIYILRPFFFPLLFPFL